MRSRRHWAAAACAAWFALGAWAQETEPQSPPPDEPAPETPAPAAEPPPSPKPKLPIGDPPLHKWGGLSVSIDAWGPELANQDYEVAVVLDGSRTRVIEMPTDASTRLHWRVWYHLPNDLGSIRFEYDSMRDEEEIETLDAGNFIYSELLTRAGFGGLSDDGLVDGFAAESTTKTREFRLEYERVAFDTPRTTGFIHVGYRNIDHSRDFEATYYSLLPAFPPFLPPAFPETFNPTSLFPIPDDAHETSDFSGNGLGVGLDAEFKIHPRVSLWGTFNVGVLRGKLDTGYESLTTFYTYAPPEGGLLYVTFEEVVELLAAGGEDAAGRIDQAGDFVGVGIRGRSQLAYTLDLSMGIEFKIWRSLSMTAGLREMVYADVAASARPDASGSLVEKIYTTGYGGFFLGVNYRF